MNRRKVLTASGLTLLGGGIVGTALGYGPLASDGSSKPSYLGDAETVYEREDLILRAHPVVVNQGETIEFEIIHTGQSEAINLGCNIPWAIQEYEDGGWEHAVWTSARYFNNCLSEISPGDTRTVAVPLSQQELDDNREMGPVDFEFSPGKYRFVLVGVRPFLAINFSISSSE